MKAYLKWLLRISRIDMAWLLMVPSVLLLDCCYECSCQQSASADHDQYGTVSLGASTVKGDYLAVNIPAYKLFVYEDDSLAWDCNVVVGLSE
ncbi:MAG: hypothetical protein IPG01_16715 [Chitinophagaceae bacterium]|nr:hypothetical protein [Chitinophagaceae bacterium]